MKATSSPKKGFSCVLGVVAPGGRLVDPAQVAAATRRRPLALEAAEDLAHQAALDAVGLHDDEGPLHGARRYHRALSRDAAPSPSRWPRTAPTT